MLAQVFAGPRRRGGRFASSDSRFTRSAAQAAGATLRTPGACTAASTTRCRAATTSQPCATAIGPHTAWSTSPTRTIRPAPGSRTAPCDDVPGAACPATCSWSSTRPTSSTSTDPGAASRPLSLLPKHPNLVVTRTFSQGLCAGGPARRLRLSRTPACSRCSNACANRSTSTRRAWPPAHAALADAAHLQLGRQATAGEREWLAAALARARGCRCAPSQTNFLLVDFGRAGRADRSGTGRSRRGAAADGRLWPADLPADHRRHRDGEPAPAGRARRGAGMSVRRWTGSPGEPVRCAANSRVPGDKSISHRAVMLAAHRRGT